MNTSTSPKVQYAYSEMSGGANNSRLTSVTYPSGYVLTYNYSSGLNDSISRLSSLSDTSGTLEDYDYLGTGTVVRRGHPQPGVDLTYIKQSGESDGAAGDQYAGLDAFGRVTDQRWLETGGGTALARHQYGYDRDSNRLWRDDAVNTAFGELYGYDGSNQLTSFQRGTLNGTKTGLTGSASRSQSFDLDAVGNFDSVTTNGGSPQTRTANAQNEVTSVSGATTPTYDANGNMTRAETGLRYVYDAWNRLVAVKDSPGTTTLKTYAYDGLNRRVNETAGGTTTDLFYSKDWQVLEEKVGSNTTKRYVWSPVYVDALVLRDRDTNADGTLDERLWVMQDANFNVVGLVDGSGSVVERYAYDPFGVRTVYDASYTVRTGGSSYDFQHGFQGMAYDAVAGLNPQRERWYSPTLGRWVSGDRKGYSAGDVNLYRFVANRVGNATDPTGRDIVLLFDPDAALGHGHMAVLIGSDSTGWHYFSFAPSSVSDLIMGGESNVKEAGFHYEYQGVTFDDLRRGRAPELRRYPTFFRFTASAARDKKAIAEAMKWEKLKYTWECNCESLSAAALKAGTGIVLPIRTVGDDHTFKSAMAARAQILVHLFFSSETFPEADFDSIPSPANTVEAITATSIGQSSQGTFFDPHQKTGPRQVPDRLKIPEGVVLPGDARTCISGRPSANPTLIDLRSLAAPAKLEPPRNSKEAWEKFVKEMSK